MASREKRPLAPSKSKQKASGDSGLSPNEVKNNKKGKSLPNVKQQQQQLTREIFDTVETGSQPPAKPEPSLPRKKALKNLKRKQNLRVTKASLIKSKVTKRVTSKNIVSPDVKRGVKTKGGVKLESCLKTIGISLKLPKDQHASGGDSEGKGTETPSKSAKNNLRTKKTKSTSSRSSGGSEEVQEETGVASGAKSSPKLGKKRAIEATDSLSKGAKTAKSTNSRKNSVKDIATKATESEGRIKGGRKSSGKELDCGTSGVKTTGGIDKFSKARFYWDKSSIDLTIDEVIASMLSDSETDSQQAATERIEGKITRSRKMLVDESVGCDIEIKKEPDAVEDTSKAASDEEYADADPGLHSQNAIQLRKRSKGNSQPTAANSVVDQVFQRSLRNGKQRHLSDSASSADHSIDPRRRRLNSEGPSVSDNNSADQHTLDCNTVADSCFASDPGNCDESQSSGISASKDEICSIKDEASKHFDEDAGSEAENNNIGDRADRGTGEMGPTLRSKTKAKTAESEVVPKDDDVVKIEETWIPSSKPTETQDDPKKLNNLDQIKKDGSLARFADKSKGRRNSLNIDMKKTVNSLYSADNKPDGNSKSQIDQMIESIKLNIAKSIESKIFGPGLSKSFDVPKIEEVIAPLNTESQKMGLDENTDEDKSVVTENEITSESSENSVPKVADTAKEIEKLVMFDIEEAETHSQNTQENQASGSDRINDVHNTCESTCNINSINATLRDVVVSAADDQRLPEALGDDETTASGSIASVSGVGDGESKDEGKRTVGTRKSLRIGDKNGSDSAAGSGPETKKLNGKTPSKVVDKPEDDDAAAAEDSDVTAKDEERETNRDTSKEDAALGLLSEDDLGTAAATVAVVSTSTSSEPAEEERLVTEKCAGELETEISLNVSAGSDESETLESISNEVERLVAEDQAAKPPLEPASMPSDAATEATTIPPDNLEIQSANKSETPACDDSAPLAPAADSTLSNTLRESDCETAQSAKHCKTSNNNINNNNNVPTVADCDSNSECSSINPALLTSSPSDWQRNDELEADKVDRDGCEKSIDYRRDSSLAANCDSAPKNPDEDSAQDRERSEQVCEAAATATANESDNKSPDDKAADEHKPVSEENRRVLRARDKQRRAAEAGRQSSRGSREHGDGARIKTEEAAGVQRTQNASVQMDADEAQVPGADETTSREAVEGEPSHSAPKMEDAAEGGDTRNNNEHADADALEPQARTRRSREGKRRREEPTAAATTATALAAGSFKGTKRAKRETARKSDQQNKEETLLDNEVAKINENNRSFLTDGAAVATVIAERANDRFHEFFEATAQAGLGKKGGSLRSKSENDLTLDDGPGKKEGQLSRNLSENHVSERDDVDLDVLARKTLKTPEMAAATAPAVTVVQKDSDETSTSSESSNGDTPKILETPEDKVKKESILRVLGLESLEKAAERLNQKARKEQQYTGTLKTVIRVQKDKDKDKRGSRSPLKMVLKQQGRGDGEGDSPEFYTIQKEFGTSGLGDSSSGANRKFTTNHRHSCDEDKDEEAAPKDRQSLVIPEKSCFSIHPERLCTDVCCYCFGKFGSLDTPMHLAQMKSDERRKKILNVERHLTKDSCLCDACYRHVDRKANTSSTNVQQKPQKQHRQLMVPKCSARECRDPARHHVKRRWLLKIKAGLQNQVDIDWESSQHTSMSFCVNHYGKIERFLTCALCKRRLVRNHTHQLASAEIDELNQLVTQQGIPVMMVAGTFVCKLCRYFTQLQLKYKDVENMNTNNRTFFKSYRKRILHCHDIEVPEDEDDDVAQIQVKDKDKRKKSAKSKNGGCSKSPDGTTNSASEKSTPEPPNKSESGANEMDGAGGKVTASGAADDSIADARYLDRTVENLKKRKLLETHAYNTTDSPVSSCGDGANDVEEILAIDKKVTLTRLPKRPKANNDIAPVVQRLGANPSISVRTLFPGEEEMNLHANIEFGNVREITPQGWEKCATMIQYDRDTKLLWQELQRPYGNQSSFLRHLILLEKYYRSGDLILAPNASRNAINYSTSVQNRLISYEGPEKMDEPIMEPLVPVSESYSNSRRLSGGYMLEKDKLVAPLPGTSSLMKPSTSHTANTKVNAPPPRMFKLNTGVSIIKKPPPNLQRYSLPSTSSAATNGAKRKEPQKSPAVTAAAAAAAAATATATAATAFGKVFHMSEPEFKRLQTLKRQKLMLNERQSGGSSSPSGHKSSSAQYQKSQQQLVATQHNQQFQQHLRMQQEMLNRQSRGDFEPLICDIRAAGSTANENSPSQNLIHNLNLPKSIQVTTKPSHPIPILPKIPKSLTVIPQTVTRPADK